MKIRTSGLGVVTVILLSACGTSQTAPSSTTGTGDSAQAAAAVVQVERCGGDAGARCRAIAAPAVATLPHVSASGADGLAISEAVGALLAGHAPPIAGGTNTYAMSNLYCANVHTPEIPQGAYRCRMDVEIDGRAAITVQTPNGSSLAETLFFALSDGGADACFARGEALNLQDVRIDIRTGATELDDASKYDLPPSPNVRATGAAAAAILRTWRAVGIDDCDPSSRVYTICNTTRTERPACAVAHLALENVGGSRLVARCKAGGLDPVTQLGDDASLAVWNAVLGAAVSVDFKPLNGTLDEVTILNASYFSWDGTTLGFDLTADNVRPPPPPPPVPDDAR